jgi:hypothetical protein
LLINAGVIIKLNAYIIVRRVMVGILLLYQMLMDSTERMAIEDGLILRRIDIMGMELDEMRYQSCTAHFGRGEDWATLYNIKSTNKNQGHATTLLQWAKWYYENLGLKFRGSVALSPEMIHLYAKLNIHEYKTEIPDIIVEEGGNTSTTDQPC